MPNETELEILTGLPVSNIDEILVAANSLISKGLKNLIVTLGEKGAIWLDGNVIHHIDPHKVNAIDTSGAGDAFIGCFAHYLVKTHDILASLKMASAFSAYSVTGQGTQISYPDKKNLSVLSVNYKGYVMKGIQQMPDGYLNRTPIFQFILLSCLFPLWGLPRA